MMLALGRPGGWRSLLASVEEPEPKRAMGGSMKLRDVAGAVLASVAMTLGMTGQSGALTLNVFTDPHPPMCCGTIGFAYIGDGFVGSVQADGTGDVLYRTDLTGGNVQIFAPTVAIASNPSSEHFVASSLGLGGFPDRDVYVASGAGIVHIDHAGTTGSPLVTMTIGIVVVAFLAARIPGVPAVRMTSTLRRTSSAANSGSRSNFPSAQRDSMTRFLPSK